MPTTLAVNRICKAKDYQQYFEVSRATAEKYMKIDKAVVNRNRLTYLDFYMLYNAFPDPNFKPHWITYFDVPKDLHKDADNCVFVL